MPTGSEIMQRAGVLLNDESHVRWPLAELCDWINEAVRATVLVKPSASSESRVLQLQAGTLQAVPQSGTPTPLALINITRNLKTAGTPRDGGRIVTPVSIEVLSAQDPYWHDKSRTPHRKEVRHYMFDEANPLEWYCYPGNDGNGIVEAVLSVLPAPLSAGSTDPNLIASYGGSIGLPEPYSVPVLEYVLFRAESKDDDGANAGRAAGHYRLFADALGIKINVEGATSPNNRRAR